MNKSRAHVEFVEFYMGPVFIHMVCPNLYNVLTFCLFLWRSDIWPNIEGKVDQWTKSREKVNNLNINEIEI